MQPAMELIDVESFSSFDDARQSAIALKKYLKLYCSKTSSSIISYIGIGLTNIQAGSVKYGFRGKKMYAAHSGHTAQAEPILHIFLLGNPGQILANMIEDYFTSRNRKVTIPSYESMQAQEAITYAIEQSLKYIALTENTEQLPSNVVKELLKLSELLNRKMNGNKPVFGSLMLSNEFFLSDDDTLANIDSEVFTSICFASKHNANEAFTSRCLPISPETVLVGNHDSKRVNNIYIRHDYGKHLTIPQSVIDGLFYFLDLAYPPPPAPYDSS